MNPKAETPKSDAVWRAEGDANTLGEAAAIQADKPRLARAAKAAGKMAKDQQVKVAALKSVAKKGKRKQ